MLASPHLAGIHFTGSTGVFHGMWKTMGNNIEQVPHATRAWSARRAARISSSPTRARIRTRWPSRSCAARFEYQGQKCRAASRVYLPSTLAAVRERRGDDRGDHGGRSSRLQPLHGRRHRPHAFREHVGYIEHARKDGSERSWPAATYDDKVGYFIQPTLVETPDPASKLMREEIFGPGAHLLRLRREGRGRRARARATAPRPTR